MVPDQPALQVQLLGELQEAQLSSQASEQIAVEGEFNYKNEVELYTDVGSLAAFQYNPHNTQEQVEALFYRKYNILESI